MPKVQKEPPDRIVLPSTLDLATERLAVPTAVTIGNGRLRWRLDNRGWQEGEVASGCLDAFVALTDGDDDACASFVRRFGPLGVLDDGRLGPSGGAFPLGKFPPEGVDRDGVRWFAERLDLWRSYAWNLRDLLDLARALRDAERFVDPDTVLAPFSQRGAADGFVFHGRGDLVHSRKELVDGLWNENLNMRRLAPQREWLATAVSESWLSGSTVEPILRWTAITPRLELGLGVDLRPAPIMTWPSAPVATVLAVGLAAALTDVHALGACTWEGCGLPVAGIRRQRKDQPRYCDRHRQEAIRKAKRESAARMRALNH